MAVMIGSARINEKGKTTGGVIGDQTGKECSTQSWYISNKGWYVIRPFNSTEASKIAKNMEFICSRNVGYSQDDRFNLYKQVKPLGFDVSKLLTPAQTDCSEAVRVCCAYAGISVSPFTTATEINTLKSTWKFEILKSSMYCDKPDYLKRGDILVTRTKGHTVVVLNDGAKASSQIYPTLHKGDFGVSVKKLQQLLKSMNLYHGSVDGDYGNLTLQAVITAQAMSEGKLVKDGICGNKTWNYLMY